MTSRLPATVQLTIDGSIETFQHDPHTNLYNGVTCPLQLHNVRSQHIVDGVWDMRYVAIFRTAPDNVKRSIPGFIIHDDGVHKYPLWLKYANGNRHGVIEIEYEGPFHKRKVEWLLSSDVLLYYNTEDIVPEEFPWSLTTFDEIHGVQVERKYLLKYPDLKEVFYVFEGNWHIVVRKIDGKIVIE